MAEFTASVNEIPVSFMLFMNWAKSQIIVKVPSLCNFSTGFHAIFGLVFLPFEEKHAKTSYLEYYHWKNETVLRFGFCVAANQDEHIENGWSNGSE